MSAKSVLLVGATGAFGERLAEGLIRSGICVIGVARDKTRLEQVARRLGVGFRIKAMERHQIDSAFLTAFHADCPGLFAVADASGPFQHSDYRLPRAAIGSGLHYVDLADARGFVRGITGLDPEASAAGVAVLAGASSTPALSHAAIDRMVAGARRVTTIDVSIAPGNRAPRGLSVMRSILSTVGRPIRVFRGGDWVDAAGWSLNKTIDLPGIGKRSAALCETPDLDLLVERYHPTSDAVFRAGLELPLLHWSVAGLGLLVRLGLVNSLEPWARPLRWLADMFKPFGTDRGGMRVDVVLEDHDGQGVRRTWTLAAGAGDGPYVPTLPSLAALKMLAANQLDWRGAAPCTGLIPYDRIAAEFASHDITAGFAETALPPSLFRFLLGDAYDTLPAAIREAHDVRGVLILTGSADAAGSDNFLGGWMARILRFPRRDSAMPLQVEMRREDDGSETWTRTYPDVTMRSNLRDADPATRQLDEAFGPISVRLQWFVIHGGLSLTGIDAKLFGIPLPGFFCPRTHATETVGSTGQFSFDVTISLPLLGVIARYKGHLQPRIPVEDLRPSASPRLPPPPPAR